MEKFQIEQTYGQWMLFIASWKFRLKAAVLLHNGNKVNLSHSFNQFTWEKGTNAFRFSCQKHAFMNIGGIHVMT